MVQDEHYDSANIRREIDVLKNKWSTFHTSVRDYRSQLDNSILYFTLIEEVGHASLLSFFWKKIAVILSRWKEEEEEERQGTNKSTLTFHCRQLCPYSLQKSTQSNISNMASLSQAASLSWVTLQTSAAVYFPDTCLYILGYIPPTSPYLETSYFETSPEGDPAEVVPLNHQHVCCLQACARCVNVSSVRFMMVFMHSERPSCPPPCLSEVSPTSPLKQFQCLDVLCSYV